MENGVMNNELVTILNYMEKDRGIDREILIEAVEFALQSAARKNLSTDGEVRVHIDRTTCDIKSYAMLTVTDAARPAKGQIGLDKARALQPGVAAGAVIEVEVPTGNLGRIAAQTAKQAILQRIRQAERDKVFEEYKNRIGDIVSGAVRQFNRSDIIVDLGRAEALLPSKERVPTEEYQVGDRIRAYVLEVQSGAPGPSVILSRSNADFVAKLFALEVSEISDGVVEIKGIAREPRYRTKIAVHSTNPKVDPVGACVGMRGMRVKNIVRELSGEKIDIIRWSEDPKAYVINALSPAKLLRVDFDERDSRVVHVVADPDQLSLAIGKRGQNVRLTARLLNMRIDIHKDESKVTFEEKVAKAIEDLAAIEGIGSEHAQALVTAGFLTVEGILAADSKVLEEMVGFTSEVAQAVYEAAAATLPDEA